MRWTSAGWSEVRGAQGYWLAGALASLTAIAIGDLQAQRPITLIPLLFIGPLIGAIALSAALTALLGLLCVVLAAGLGIHDALAADDLAIRLGGLALASALCAYVAEQRSQRARAFEEVAHVAEVAQRAILRPPPRALGNVALAARYVSATERALIGGDLYETAYSPFGVRLVVGDVRGKGLDAVRLASSVLGAFRGAVFEAADLAVLASVLDECCVAEASSEEDFVTAVLIEFPPAGDGIDVVNCGHHPPVRLHHGEISLLAPPHRAPPLGLHPACSVERFPFAAGDRLVAYTDGLVEAKDAQGAFFPFVTRVGGLSEGPLDEGLDGLLEDVTEHVGASIGDDLAVVVAERLK
jgi:sigma-B regulation protein RsbU (phosphoserine phosphatase)